MPDRLFRQPIVDKLLGLIAVLEHGLPSIMRRPDFYEGRGTCCAEAVDTRLRIDGLHAVAPRLLLQ